MESATIVKIVTDLDTAAVLGSGSLAVLGTPRLLAWIEEATCSALVLPDGSTSVGAKVELEHLAPSRVGERITVSAEVTAATARRAEFKVSAQDAAGRMIARGLVVRAIVDREAFLSRLAAR